MPQPPAYHRIKDFTEDFGHETDHSALNAELDTASNSINDIRINLAILQADDGKLRPSVVTADSISYELRSSLVDGVVMDAQAMLDRSLEAADAASRANEGAEASLNTIRQLELASASSAAAAALSEKKVLEIADELAAELGVHADWQATEGATEILNKPTTLEEYGILDEVEDRIHDLVPASFPTGTTMLFVQSTAPIGWTKSTEHNDKALRIVSGAAGAGGSGVGSLQIISVATSAAGGSGSHTHAFTGNAINMAVQYVDAIIAVKG